MVGELGDRWIGGSVDRWIGGSVDRWIGGSVDRWIGESVDRWIGGSVAQRGNSGTITRSAPTSQTGVDGHSIVIVLCRIF